MPFEFILMQPNRISEELSKRELLWNGEHLPQHLHQPLRQSPGLASGMRFSLTFDVTELFWIYEIFKFTSLSPSSLHPLCFGLNLGRDSARGPLNLLSSGKLRKVSFSNLAYLIRSSPTMRTTNFLDYCLLCILKLNGKMIKNALIFEITKINTILATWSTRLHFKILTGSLFAHF